MILGGAPFSEAIKTSYKTSFRDGPPLESISRGGWCFRLPLGIAYIFKGGWYYGAPLETEAFVRLENHIQWPNNNCSMKNYNLSK
jgi:hypothetical protein